MLGRCLVRGTRPNRRQGSPAAAPRGDPGCRLGWAGSGAGCSRFAAPARAPAAVREEGGVGETPGNSNSGRQSSSSSLAPARCRRRRVRASKTNLPPPLPVSMPSAAVGEPQRPGPGQRSVAKDSPPPPPLAGSSRGQVGARARGARVSKCKAERVTIGCGKFVGWKGGLLLGAFASKCSKDNQKQCYRNVGPAGGVFSQSQAYLG